MPLVDGAGSLEPVLRLTGFGIADADAGPTVAYLTGCLSPLLAGNADLPDFDVSSGANATRRGPLALAVVDFP